VQGNQKKYIKPFAFLIIKYKESFKIFNEMLYSIGVTYHNFIINIDRKLGNFPNGCDKR